MLQRRQLLANATQLFSINLAVDTAPTGFQFSGSISPWVNDNSMAPGFAFFVVLPKLRWRHHITTVFYRSCS